MCAGYSWPLQHVCVQSTIKWSRLVCRSKRTLKLRVFLELVCTGTLKLCCAVLRCAALLVYSSCVVSTLPYILLGMWYCEDSWVIVIVIECMCFCRNGSFSGRRPLCSWRLHSCTAVDGENLPYELRPLQHPVARNVPQDIQLLWWLQKGRQVPTDSLTVCWCCCPSVRFLSFKICSSLLVRSLIYTPQDDSAYAPVGHSSPGDDRNLSLVPVAVTYV